MAWALMSRKLACLGIRLGGPFVQEATQSGKLICQGHGRETCPRVSFSRKQTCRGPGRPTCPEAALSRKVICQGPGKLSRNPVWLHFVTISTHLGSPGASGGLGKRPGWEVALSGKLGLVLKVVRNGCCA